ncbi:sigma-70 family RNA polymerase sigma factor [Clostridium haemolyticum]|uniref:sigma-70 family RNA polymerase sigma factor n=1 Tax=Clostridium haemolyticum TaxID=84025 RepID=UPI0006900B9E|nr:sigma-70 family RNA polymerase sigma factor [Clostridium haemolyticum]
MELTYNDNNALIEKAQKGDKNAFELSFELNKPLVISTCKKFFNKEHEAEDIIQMGNIGLVKAIKNFNPKEYDVKFSSYAVPMIMGEVQRFLRDTNPIKIPRPLLDIRNKIKYIEYLLERKFNRSPTIEEIVKETGFTVEEVQEGLKLSNTNLVQSIEKIIHSDGSTFITLADNIEGNVFKEDTVLNNILVQEAIKQLNPQLRAIIELRYFKDKTQVETAKLLGITQVHVSRQEKKALNKLREILSVKEYKENKRYRRREGEMSKKEKAFELFKKGLTNTEVVKTLGITMSTVTTYRSYYNKKNISFKPKEIEEIEIPKGTKIYAQEPKKNENKVINTDNINCKEVTEYVHKTLEIDIEEQKPLLKPTTVEGLMKYIKDDEVICIEDKNVKKIGAIAIEKSKLDLFIKELQEIKSIF